MILLIDNYDSFTFNLVHYLGDVGARCDVRRNDSLTVAQAMAMVSDKDAAARAPATRSPVREGLGSASPGFHQFIGD